jgi:cyclin-dependent kinase 12/13
MTTAQNKVDLSQGHVRARNVHEAFEKLRQLGHGTYGEVYLARDRVTNEQVALKKIKLEASKEKRSGFPITALREMRVLKQLDHANVVKLKEVCRSNSALPHCAVRSLNFGS